MKYSNQDFDEDMAATREVEAKQKVIDTDKHVAELQKKYPWAKAAGGKLSRHARAAANIRKELKLAFPGVKFTVRSDSFSMGNSVDIGWTCGPTTSEVEEITNKYQEGNFDGMLDMYCHDSSASGDAIELVLGRSKYVQTQRHTDDIHERVGHLLCEAQHVEYAGRNTQYVYGSGDDRYLSDHIYQIIQHTSFPLNGVISGIENNRDDHITGYQLTFDVPEVKKKSVGEQFAEVQKHYHTKRGIDFWIVVLAGKVERDDFTIIRDKCKTAGGWYSRKWGSTPGGFAFDNQNDAEKFVAYTIE